MGIKCLAMLVAVLALSVAAVACGGDDDDTSGNGDQPATTADAPDDGDGGDGDGNGDGSNGGGFGSGTGTLTIADETWEITGVGCVFSAEEAGNPDFPFNLAGFGESSTGVRAQLSADIYDPSGQERLEGDGVTHSISFYDSEDFENPSVSWESIEATGITIDGKRIQGEGAFNDGTTDEFEAVPGTMDVVCP